MDREGFIYLGSLSLLTVMVISILTGSCMSIDSKVSNLKIEAKNQFQQCVNGKLEFCDNVLNNPNAEQYMKVVAFNKSHNLER